MSIEGGGIQARLIVRGRRLWALKHIEILLRTVDVRIVVLAALVRSCIKLASSCGGWLKSDPKGFACTRVCLYLGDGCCRSRESQGKAQSVTYRRWVDLDKSRAQYFGGIGRNLPWF